MSDNIEKAPNVPPFVTFVTSAVPMVFDNSMSYYEALCALWKWLQDDVIDVINNNASVTDQYITLTNELKEFVENYFDNLDVQQEINNKLDQMTQDGSLSTLIGNYIQPIADEQNARISDIASRVDASVSGAPLVASSVAGMTDTDRVYVNTSDGYWYYYDGDSWEQGGVYQASEDSDTLVLLDNKFELISETSSVNKFDMSRLLLASGWTYSNGVYSGTATALRDTFTADNPFLSMNNATEWILTLDIYTDGNELSTGAGLRFYFDREGTTSDVQAVANTNLSWNHYTFKSPNNNVTPYTALHFAFGSGGNNIWHIKNAQLLLGTATAADYDPYYTAKDIKARADIADINQELDTGVINPVKLVANAMSGDPLTIKLLGDSITAGYGGTNFDDSESSGGTFLFRGHYQNLDGECWANSLKSYVESKFPNVTVKNYGVTGAKSADLNTFFEITPLVDNNDDVVIVMIGTNDRGDSNAKQTLYNNLVTLYGKIKAMNKKMIIMANIPASVSNETTHDLNMHMEDVDMVVNTFAINNNVPYISVYKLFIEYCKYAGVTIDSLLGDGLHPNDAGYEVMFNLISNELGFSTERPDATW